MNFRTFSMTCYLLAFIISSFFVYLALAGYLNPELPDDYFTFGRKSIFILVAGFIASLSLLCFLDLYKKTSAHNRDDSVDSDWSYGDLGDNPPD